MWLAFPETIESNRGSCLLAGKNDLNYRIIFWVVAEIQTVQLETTKLICPIDVVKVAIHHGQNYKLLRFTLAFCLGHTCELIAGKRGKSVSIPHAW